MRLCVFGLAFAALAGLSAASAEPDDSVPLRNDASRAQLARRAMLQEFGGVLPAAPSKKFKFPADTGDGVYGIDVSHHNEDSNGPIDWRTLTGQGIFFVYAKASQGERFKDDRFVRTWSELGQLQQEGKDVYRGAYHFLSANGDPVVQAENFLRKIGTLGPKDLPPCVDIEWNEPDKDSPDSWLSFDEATIVDKLSKFIAAVEAGTGRKPIIYTHNEWWRHRIPHSQAFAGAQIWISDFSTQALDPTTPVDQLKPKIMNGHQWTIWQFTDKGKASYGGLPDTVDVNLFKGSTGDFERIFGLAALVEPPPAPAEPTAAPVEPAPLAPAEVPSDPPPVPVEPPVAPSEPPAPSDPPPAPDDPPPVPPGN